jgi:hypothetical protein
MHVIHNDISNACANDALKGDKAIHRKELGWIQEKAGKQKLKNSTYLCKIYLRWLHTAANAVHIMHKISNSLLRLLTEY